MNKLLRFSLGLLFATLLIASTTQVARAEGEVSTPFESFMAPDTVKSENIQKAICQALIGRGWEVKERSATKVVGFIKKGIESEVLFEIDGSKISMSCWGYRLNRDGGRKAPEVPVRWLRWLKADINKALYAL